MIINDRHKFVYIAIPKTGTYSMHYCLGQHQHPEPALHHAGIKDVERHGLANYFQFAFVRNPWDKLVSMYFDFTLRRGRQYSEKVVMDTPLLSEFKDFEGFCLGLGESKWLQDVFFKPQLDFVTRSNGQLVDFIGRFENMQTGFNFVCDQVGIPRSDLTHANKGQYAGTYRQHYTDAAREAVATVYAADIEAFGYEF